VKRPVLPLGYRLLCFVVFGGLPGLLGILLYAGVIPSHRPPRCGTGFCGSHWTLLSSSLAMLSIGAAFLVPRGWPGLYRLCALGAIGGFAASLAGVLLR